MAQVDAKAGGGGFASTVKGIVKERGPLGLWRGLGTVLVGE
eukprot:gene11195-4435_t